MSDLPNPGTGQKQVAVFRHQHDYRHDLRVMGVYLPFWLAVYFLFFYDNQDILYFLLSYCLLLVFYLAGHLWAITGIEFADDVVIVHRRLYTFRLNKNQVTFIAYQSMRGFFEKLPALVIIRPGWRLAVKLNELEFTQFKDLIDYLKSQNMLKVKS